MTTDDLIMCKKCGGKDTWLDVSTINRGDGSVWRYWAAVNCANPHCDQSGIGQHKSEAKAIQLAKQDWTDRNEVIL